MYAVVQTGGKQYKVSAGDIIQVEKLDSAIGESVMLDKIIMTGDGDNVQVGTPFLNGFSVTAEVSEQIKEDKDTLIEQKNTKTEKGIKKNIKLNSLIALTIAVIAYFLFKNFS